MSGYFFEGHPAKPLTGLDGRAPKGRPTRTPPPVIPHPESLSSQGDASTPADRAQASLLGSATPSLDVLQRCARRCATVARAAAHRQAAAAQPSIPPGISHSLFRRLQSWAPSLLPVTAGHYGREKQGGTHHMIAGLCRGQLDQAVQTALQVGHRHGVAFINSRRGVHHAHPGPNRRNAASRTNGQGLKPGVRPQQGS